MLLEIYIWNCFFKQVFSSTQNLDEYVQLFVEQFLNIMYINYSKCFYFKTTIIKITILLETD